MVGECSWGWERREGEFVGVDEFREFEHLEGSGLRLRPSGRKER